MKSTRKKAAEGRQNPGHRKVTLPSLDVPGGSSSEERQNRRTGLDACGERKDLLENL